MTVNRVHPRADQLGYGIGSAHGPGSAPGGQGGSDGPTGSPLQAMGYGSAEPVLDPVEAYFECITTCSLDDGDCVTTCTEILRQHS
jgi:hypothetical protein